MDKREDAGDYYPGGKTIPRRPVNPDPLEDRVADVENRMTTAEEEIAGKQDTLTFDSVPTANSQNPVRSGGIWSAIWGTIATQYTSVAAWAKAQFAPASNILKSALAATVQASLDKADTALQTAPVASVNGKTGTVALSADDIPLGMSNVADAIDLKVDRDTSAAEGNIPVFDSNGNIEDSGKKPTDFAPATNIQKAALASAVQSSLDKADAALPKSGGTMTGALALTGDKKISFFDTSGTRELRIGLGADYFAIELYSYGSLSLAWRTPFSSGRFALAVDNATAGHLAALDQYGSLVDSGKAPTDFAPATNIPKTALASAVQASLDKADAAATKADATLTPVYSDTPTFSEWVCNPAVPTDPGGNPLTINSITYQSGYWVLNTTPYGNIDATPGSETDTTVVFSNLGYHTQAITATRARTDITGYTLGSQTDRPLQPAGDYAAMTKTVTVAATETMLPPDCFPIRYADGGTTVELSADEVEFTSQFVLRIKDTSPVIALATFARPNSGQTIADFSQHPDITFGGRAPTAGVWPAYLREGETYSETYKVVYSDDLKKVNIKPLAGQTFDFTTVQGVIDALKATIEALGGAVTGAPTTSTTQGA